GDAAELLEHRSVIFIAAGAEDHADRTAAAALPQASAERCDRVDVVGGIEQNLRAVALCEPFDSSSTADRRQPCGLPRQRGLRARLSEQVEHDAGDRGVAPLVLTDQRHFPAMAWENGRRAGIQIEHFTPAAG